MKEAKRHHLFFAIFYLDIPMLASRMMTSRVQLRFGSENLPLTSCVIRLGCPAACCTGAPPVSQLIRHKEYFADLN